MKNSYYPTAFFEGKFINTEDAKVSIMTNALQYGTAFFGGIRGYYNKESKHISIFRLDDHITRFYSSAKILGVQLPYTHAEMKKIIITLLEKNKPETDVYFRPFAYAPTLFLSPNLNENSQFEFAVYLIPMGEYLPIDKGLNVCVSSWRRISDNSIPSRAKISGAYVNSALARKEAADKGYDEAIFLTEGGHVAEGSAENIFIVRDGMIITPSSAADVLEGITRKTIFQLAKDLDIPSETREIDRSELYICDEAFFSGTGVQVSWISSVDGRQVGTGARGPITTKIQKMFFQTVKGMNKKYENWYTKFNL